MKSLRWSIRFAFTFTFLLISCFAALAESRVFVSGLGDDLNPCTRPSPCRNFQRGHNVVAAGGEVVALDSAGYGAVTITKSVTITGEGVMAGITAASGNGITIATAGITVNLRSLSIQGIGSGSSGIYATDFTVLHIENCIVNGFVSIGIYVKPSTVGTRKVFIKDSISRNNADVGIVLFSGSGMALIATVEGTRTENNGPGGIVVDGSSAIVTARGCLSSGNDGVGLQSQNGAVLNIESSVASHNGAQGIQAANGGTVRVSTSTVTNNTSFGFSKSDGNFESRGNNTVAGNNGGGAQTDVTITVIAGT
jgi:hypothetical protein